MTLHELTTTPPTLRVVPDAQTDVRPLCRPLPPSSVRRTRLVRRLTRATAPLAMLVAPAGYGKTTLLQQWAEADARPVAWIALTEGDNDPPQLLAAIAARLDEIESTTSELVPMLTRPTPAAGFVPRLAWALEPPRRPMILVLDDAHLLREPAAVDALRALAQQVATGSTLALASRSELSLPVGRMRSEGVVTELGAPELAMDEDEAATLLRRTGLLLSPAEMTLIFRRTEGWPAGLRLAALSLQAQDDPSAAAARFAGDDRFVVDYLREELLAHLDPDDVAFLTRTSLLGALTGPLCDSVLGRRGSGRVLRELAHANFLLAPVDRSEQRFRTHPMLADMLRVELRRDEPNREAEIHRRASAWHEQHDELDRAIEHAAAAGDDERAGALLWRLTPSHAASGRGEALGAWLDSFGDARISMHPTLALAAAVHRLMRGDRDRAERWADAAERGLSSTSAASGDSLLAGLSIVRSGVARHGVERMGEDATRAYTLSEADSPWRAFACAFRGSAALATGDADQARAQLDEGARRGADGAPGARVLCLAQLALLALEQDDWDHGAELAGRAREELAQVGLGDAPACALVFAVAAFARAHSGRVEEARHDVRASRRALAALPDVAPWLGLQVRIALARAELRLSDAAAARELLVEASRMLRAAPAGSTLQAWVDDGWGRADTFAAGAVAGPTSLTTAELRVLRFLPSHLSFREIAARLHVSANTVKSQAHAVYRKLDASSRSEAVARARDVGLVDG
jgi:LuxR family transcriptional regulator, maltose regulon positive regulatory protein